MKLVARPSTKANEKESNDSRGSQSSGKGSLDSGIRTQKADQFEKKTANLNLMTPPAKRKSEQIEKQKNAGPLRRYKSDKTPFSSVFTGSKNSDQTPEPSLDRERKTEKKKSVKPLPIGSYKALFKITPKKVELDRADHSDDLNRTGSGSREVDCLEKLTERTRERTAVTSTNQHVKEELEENNGHKLFSTSQKDSCKEESSLDRERKKEKKETSVKPLPIGSYKELFKITPKKVELDRADHSDDLNRTDSGSREVDCLEKLTERTRERTAVTSTNQHVKEELEEISEHKLFSTSQKDSCKDISSKEDGPQVVKNGLVDLQTWNDRNTCIVCKLGGTLLFCHGKDCQRSYHLSCLEPPLEEFHLGFLYCLLCVRKKIESGVHSVSEGIEAIWDYKELEASQDNGFRRQKQYFVKYKGLAHVHNLWIPENQVFLEAPSLVAKYRRKNQSSVWKQHWAVPHRLLQKRLLATKECDENHCNEHEGDKLNCHFEWLVKWCGLGYEHASWELENASFFTCPKGHSLIRDYETRHKKVQIAPKYVLFPLYLNGLLLTNKELAQDRAISSGIDANLDAIKLHNCWPRNQNAVLFYDQERISEVISSIMSFPSDKSRPFLIISTSTLLYLWDEEFLRLSPSTYVVVYSGSKEIRNSIRNMEFYEERGRIMFQVLITSPEVVCEDLNVLEWIGWEAIIVDECQRPKIAACFEQIKMLTASQRLLIISSQLKDNVIDYINLLSLLESQSDSNGSDSVLTNSSDSISILKDRLAKYVAYGSSRFVEYWVPVLLSNVQLEQYCFTLLSNSLYLCSPSKIDPVGALRSILISSRKCSDHPYVVDQSLQKFLTKGLNEVEFLDVGIKASGKFQLLDAMLLEIKKQELKVLVLFQYTGGRDLMGDILDDFLRQRFGRDSFERVDDGITRSKKQSALDNFNNERERFVFLLETRACRPSIKLSAISTVIIFGSDWSPMNDRKALQKIKLDSPIEHIKVFRLYSSFTVEEKVLMLSKQGKTLDSNIENISCSCSHMLLKWGASYLFNQVEKFNGISTLDARTLPEESILKDVIQEFVLLLHQTRVDNDAIKLSLILQANQNQGMYRTEMPLFGEQKVQVMNEDPPHIFWTKLFERKSQRWKYYSSFQRNCKRVHYCDGLQKFSEDESVEVIKRRKKVVNDENDHLSPKPELQEDREGSSGASAYGSSPLSKLAASGSDKIRATSNPIAPANDISVTPSLNMVEWERRIKQLNSQKSLHDLLLAQIEKLCEVLHFSEDAKALAVRFLEYVMNNHLINREPETILQAFQISLCWCAASLSKQKIDHKKSLALAKDNLGFTCKKNDADYINSMLRCLNRMFLYRTHTGYLKVTNFAKASELSSKAVGRDTSNATSYQQNVKAVVEDLLGFQEASDAQVIAESGLFPEFQLAQVDLVKSLREIEKKFDKKMTKITMKQKKEFEQYKQKYEKEKAQLENMKRTEACVIRLHSSVLMRSDKLKNLDIEYARKFDELKQRLDLDLKNCEALQVAERDDVLERKTRWVESVKSWARIELVKPPVCVANLSKGSSSASLIQSAGGSEVRLSEIVPDKVTTCNDPIDLAGPKENSVVASIEEGSKTICSAGGVEQDVYNDSCPRELVSVGEISDGGVQVHVPLTFSSGNVTETVLSLRCSDEDQISDESELNKSNGNLKTVSPADAADNIVSMEAFSCEETSRATLSKPNKEVSLEATESVSFCDGQNNLTSLQAPSSEKGSDIDTLINTDGETPLKESGTVISGEGRENLVSLEEPLSVGIPDGHNSSKVNGQVPLKEAPITNSNEGQKNYVSAEAPSSEKIPDGAALGKDVEDIDLRTTKISISGGCLENCLSLEVPSSREILDGPILSNLDGEVQLRAVETVNSGQGNGNLLSLVAPLSELFSIGTTLSMAGGDLPLSAHEVVSSSEGQGKVACANSSSEKQIPCGDKVNVPDREVPKGTLKIATSSDGMNNIVCTNPSTSKEPREIPNTAALSVSTEEISLAESEARTEVFEGGSTHIENLEPEFQDQSLYSSKVDGQVLLKETPVSKSNEDQKNHVSTEAPSSAEILDGAALGKDAEDTHLRTAKIVKSGGCLENSLSLETTYGEIPDGPTLSNLDGEVQFRAAETINSEKGNENLLSVVASLSEKNCTRTTLSMVDEKLPLSAHEVVSSSEGRGNSSSEKQIPCGAKVNVPDREVPKSTLEITRSSDDMIDIVCTNPSTSKESGEIPDTAAFSVPSEVISLAESEPRTEVFEGGSTFVENDGTNAIQIDQQDGLLCTMNLEPELEEQLLPDLSSLQPVPTSDQNSPLPRDLVSRNVGSLPCASSGIQAKDVANNEMQNVSQVAETLPCSGPIDMTCNVSNPDTPAVELRVQIERLRSTESISNLSLPDLPSVSATEHQPNNDGQNANQISQSPRQSMTNTIEPSNQIVMQPLHSPINSAVGDLRQVSETRIVSLPSVSRDLPLQTASHVSFQMPLPLYHDPLKNEIERICKEKDQIIKFHEDTKMQLKLECEKEIEEVVAQIRRKYEAKLREKETEFLLLKKELDVNCNQVLLNKILAEVFGSNYMNNRASSSAGLEQEADSNFMQQMLQPSTADGLPSIGLATSMHTISPAAVNTQTMSPSFQVVNPSEFFSSTPASFPRISSISLSTGSLQMGSEIRASAPHIQTFSPLASISPRSLPLQSRGMSSQLAHNLTHRQPSTTCQTGLIQPEIAGGFAALPNSYSPSLDVLLGMNNHLSCASANPSSNLLPGVSSWWATSVHQDSHDPIIQPNPTQQIGCATHVICLSDDD